MTATEMSTEFNIVYESIASMAAPGYTEKEKSILLTEAQEEIALDVANGGADKDDYSRTVLAKLLTPYTELPTPTLATNVFGNVNTTRAYTIVLPITAGSEFFCPFIEFAVTGSGATAYERVCKPIDYDTYYSSIANPWANPYVDLYWRLYDGDHMTIITDGTALATPYLKGLYVKKPTPIITAKVTVGSIDGYTAVTDPILNPIVHREIVYRAAKKAFAAVKDQVGYQIQNNEENKD